METSPIQHEELILTKILNQPMAAQQLQMIMEGMKTLQNDLLAVWEENQELQTQIATSPTAKMLWQCRDL